MKHQIMIPCNAALETDETLMRFRRDLKGLVGYDVTMFLYRQPITWGRTKSGKLGTNQHYAVTDPVDLSDQDVLYLTITYTGIEISESP